MKDIELTGITAEEKQRYFEQLCALPEQELQKLWENSEVRAKLQKLFERFAENVEGKKRLEELEANSAGCKYCRDLFLLLVDVNGQKMDESGDGTITDVEITQEFVEGKFCPMCGRKIPSSAAARRPAE